MKYILIMFLLIGCVKEAPCPKIPAVPIPVVGDCYRAAHAYFRNSSPVYKITQVGKVSALLEYKETYRGEVSDELIYLFEEIHKNLQPIDCLGKLK